LFHHLDKIYLEKGKGVGKRRKRAGKKQGEGEGKKSCPDRAYCSYTEFRPEGRGNTRLNKKKTKK
jgi:hypothetical protein